ncbi:MAG: hypothetical protein E6Q97_31685 [Desulfurellales bacterium]|nr:MAG: hypothetical protein E6Q97_31685 [Desulfurellales bacterium]
MLGTTGQPDLTSVDIRAILVDTGTYTYSAAHNFLDDVAAGARIAVSGAMTGKTFASVATGVFDADDVTFSSVSGASVEAIILYVHTGVEATSRLLAYIDTGVTGLPFTPSGGNVTIQWPAGGIFIL